MNLMVRIERLNEALTYIENHLQEEMDMETLGRIAHCSSYHFQRMFGYMAGVSLGEYLRRRRMSQAAVDLQKGEEKVIDIALKYGYSSPTAFTRAFQGVHGVSPSQVKEGGAVVKSFPPISFMVQIKGGEAMEYKIAQKEGFRIIGIGEKMEKEVEKNFELVPKMWAKAVKEGIIPVLAEKMNGEP